MGWIADLLKEIPSAARYKSELEALATKAENADVASQQREAEYAAGIQTLQGQICSLEEQLASQHRQHAGEIRSRDKQIDDLNQQLSATHLEPLDDVKQRIIGLLAEESKTTKDLAGLTGLSEEAIAFHLEDDRMKVLAVQTNLGLCVSVALTPDGRHYAAKHNLLRTQ